MSSRDGEGSDGEGCKDGDDKEGLPKALDYRLLRPDRGFYGKRTPLTRSENICTWPWPRPMALLAIQQFP